MAEYYEPSTSIVPDVQAEENRIVNKALSKLPAPYISGLKLKADIKLGNLTLNTIDSNDVVWVCTDIEGWWNLPDPELPDLPRGWGDGSYDAKGRYAARLLTLNGAFLTQDPSQVELARQTLFKAIDLVYDNVELVVSESPVVKVSTVRLSGRPQIDTVTARGRTEFSIGLKASDPIKYEYLEPIVATPTNASPATPSSGSVTYTTSAAHGFTAGQYVTVAGSSIAGYNGTFLISSTPLPTTFVVSNATTGTETWSSASATVFEDGYRIKTLAAGTNSAFVNSGSTKTPIIVELIGPIAAGVTVINTIDYETGYGDDTTETITVTTAVPSGSKLEIDTLNREAILVTGDTIVNGRSYISTLSDWIYLQPSFKGTNTIALSGSTGSAKIFYRSGWIG
jgi:hypothetical protein